MWEIAGGIVLAVIVMGAYRSMACSYRSFKRMPINERRPERIYYH